MVAKNRKSYFAYFNKLVDQYNNTYYHSIGKKCINAYYSALTEKIEKNLKSTKFKLNSRVTVTRIKINKYKKIFNKRYNENWSREIFVINSVLKTKPWMYKIKDSNGEK